MEGPIVAFRTADLLPGEKGAKVKGGGHLVRQPLDLGLEKGGRVGKVPFRKTAWPNGLVEGVSEGIVFEEPVDRDSEAAQAVPRAGPLRAEGSSRGIEELHQGLCILINLLAALPDFVPFQGPSHQVAASREGGHPDPGHHGSGDLVFTKTDRQGKEAETRHPGPLRFDPLGIENLPPHHLVAPANAGDRPAFPTVADEPGKEGLSCGRCAEWCWERGPVWANP